MKKLILLLFLLIPLPAYAGTVTLGNVSGDGAVSTINDNFTVVANRLNGNIEGSTDSGSTVSNLKADTVFEINMADDANPRIRDSEIFNITTDSITAQNAFVEDGLIPATSANLTSDISAGTCFVNGYRVDKSATSKTYNASKDTWVDVSQAGVFSYTEVANGAAEPAVAANSARLAKVVTDADNITSVTDEANRSVPGLVVPTYYRDGLLVSRDGTTTMIVLPGRAEINGTMLTKTANTTLTLTTAGDWAGGSSLQATSTYGYVGMDSSGNLKLHTTKPAFDNYAVTTTAGKKRFATWSSTVYRILGWFFMNATGSGELNTYEVGNIREFGIPNYTNNLSTTVVTTTSTTFADDTQALSRFYSSGGPVQITYNTAGDQAAGVNFYTTMSVDSAGIVGNDRAMAGDNITEDTEGLVVNYVNTIAENTHTMQGKFRAGSGTSTITYRSLIIDEK